MLMVRAETVSASEGGDGVGEAAAKSCLARWVLTEASREYAAHDALGDFSRINNRTFNGCTHGDGAELYGRQMGERTEELADRCSCCTDDDNFAHESSRGCGEHENQQRAKRLLREQRSIRRSANERHVLSM